MFVYQRVSSLKPATHHLQPLPVARCCPIPSDCLEDELLNFTPQRCEVTAPEGLLTKAARHQPRLCWKVKFLGNGKKKWKNNLGKFMGKSMYQWFVDGFKWNHRQLWQMLTHGEGRIDVGSENWLVDA